MANNHTNAIEKQNESRKPFPTEEKKISIEDFIKETQRDPTKYPRRLNWIDFETFTNIKQIGEGGFAKVYSATWLSGGKKLMYTDPNNKAKKIRTLPCIVALKSIKGSNEISVEYLNEVM